MSIIEKFFNPRDLPSDRVLLNKDEALAHCRAYFTLIRHYSFRGDDYLKNDGTNIVWKDGSEVDIDSLPSDDGWGIYFNDVHNLCSF